MSKKIARMLIEELDRIRFKLDDMENCEDGLEMVAIAQDLSADIDRLQEVIENKFKL